MTRRESAATNKKGEFAKRVEKNSITSAIDRRRLSPTLLAAEAFFFVLLWLANSSGFLVALGGRLSPATLQFNSTFFSETPFLVVLALVSLRLRGLRCRDIGLQWPADWKRAIAKAAVAAVLFSIFSQLVIEPAIYAVFGARSDVSSYYYLQGNWPALLKLVVLAWIFGAVGEEFFWRGYLLNRMLDLAGPSKGKQNAALFGSSILFGLAHGYMGLAGILITAIWGLFYGSLYLICKRNLLPSIVSHGLTDSLIFVLFYFGRFHWF